MIHTSAQACVMVGLSASLACLDEPPTGGEARPTHVVRGYDDAAGCIPEVITTSTDSTEEVLVTFTTTEAICYPNLVEWGIDMADPIGVDTPQGNGFFQIRSQSDLANVPSPPQAAFGAYYTPSQVMIEFDPPVTSVAFHYSRLQGENARWGGQWVQADSMLVRAMSRTPGTQFYQTYDSEVLYSNVGRTTPPWDTWTHVTLAAPGDYIQWLWFDGRLVIDDLRTVRAPLSCTSPVLRGQHVACTVSAAGMAVQGWSFVPDDVALPAVAESSTATTWQGQAAFPGQVSVTVSDGVTARQYNDRFEVAPRPSSWSSRWAYTEGAFLTLPDSEPHVPMKLGRNCNATGCAQNNRVEPNPFSQTDAGAQVTRVTSGPNAGYWFVEASQWVMDRVGNLSPGILPSSARVHPLPASTPNKCKKKLGFGVHDDVEANFYNYNKHCRNVDMDDMIAAAWGHEGFGYNGGHGHEGLARSAAAESLNDPYAGTEALVWTDSLQLMSLVRSVVIPIDARIIAAADDAPETGESSLYPSGNWEGRTLWWWNEGSMLYEGIAITGF